MSGDDFDNRYRAALAAQLTKNRATWSRLQELGVTSSTELRLDFWYDGVGTASANLASARPPVISPHRSSRSIWAWTVLDDTGGVGLLRLRRHGGFELDDG